MAIHARTVLRLLWHLVRLPVLTVLLVLEHIVRFLLPAIALLAIFMSVFFELSGVAPQFPLWGMLGLSIACGLVLLGYYALMSFFSR